MRTSAFRTFAAAILSVFVWLGASSQGWCEDASADDALRNAERGTVRVVALYLDAGGEVRDASVGSGFVVAAQRVVTNAHVVSEQGQVADIIFVIPDRGSGGQGVRAEVVDGSQAADLAILQAEKLIAPVLTLSSAIPGKAQTVHAIGYPGVTDRLRKLSAEEMLSPSQPYVTSGSIALLSQRAPGGSELPTIFHTAAVNLGNSGGPLVDECGRVIGINTWGAAAEVTDSGVSVPAGQFIATRMDTLIPLLTRAGVSVSVQEKPCTPAVPVDPELQARLQATERALAAQGAELAKVKAETVAEERARANQAMVIGSLGVALCAAIAANAVWRRENGKALRVGFSIAAALALGAAAGMYLWAPSSTASAEGARSRFPSDGPTVEALASPLSESPDTALEPSFDCREAGSFAEKTICSDQALATRDRAMAQLYKQALSHGDHAAVRTLARARWLEREQCGDRECLLAWFDRRQAELSEDAPPKGP